MRDFKPQLLIVDDALPRMSLLGMLTALHYAVRVAPEGFAALAEMRKQVPDVILSELNIPTTPGFELPSVVRCRLPSLRAIAMSSEFVGRAVPLGVAADAFHPKKSHPGLLLRIISGIMRPRRSMLTHRTLSLEPVGVPPRAISREPYVGVTCPGDLRALLTALHISTDSQVEAECVYCRSPIHCSMNPVLPRNLRCDSRATQGQFRNVTKIAEWHLPPEAYRERVN